LGDFLSNFPSSGRWTMLEPVWLILDNILNKIGQNQKRPDAKGALPKKQKTKLWLGNKIKNKQAVLII